MLKFKYLLSFKVQFNFNLELCFGEEEEEEKEIVFVLTNTRCSGGTKVQISVNFI